LVWTGFGFKKKIQFGYFFFIKTEPNGKWSSLLIASPLFFRDKMIKFYFKWYKYDFFIIYISISKLLKKHFDILSITPWHEKQACRRHPYTPVAGNRWRKRSF
jgi:hypothetical protein